MTTTAGLDAPRLSGAARPGLCTDCGVSRMADAKACGRACQFIRPDYPRLETAVHGRPANPSHADEFFFGPMLMADGVPTMQLLGKRVIFADDMQALGTGSNLAVAYGDFGRAYTILDRVGLQVLRDPYTEDPYTIFRLRRRTGGDVTSFDAVKLMRLAAS
jgi:hypothetical protein